MKRPFIKLIPMVLSITLIISLMTSCTQKAEVPGSEAKPALNVSNMDTTVKPGDDFFGYANGGWLKKNPIPADESRFGAFEELRNENFNALKELFENAAAAKNPAKGSIDQKIGDFYASGMDSVNIEKDGIAPLKPELEKIDKIANVNDLLAYTAILHTSNIYPLFGVYAGQDEKNSQMMIANFYQGGLGLPDRDFYFEKDARSQKIREEYLKHLTKIFQLIGYQPEASTKAAETIMNIETGLAKASRTRVALRDPNANYNKMTLADLQKKIPGIDWAFYFKNIGVENPGDINVGQPEFFENVAAMMKSVSIEDWKLYLKWNLVNTLADYLSKDFVDQNFEFYGKVLSGKIANQPRWKRIVNSTSESLGELVGQLFVKKYFPPEAKAKMLDLVGNLKKALAEHIKNLVWMGDATKTEALAKLNKINVKIGYPNKWIDYSKLEISRDSYVQNVLRASRFQFELDIKKIGKPVDKDEWHMTPQTVNAYYNPNLNEIVFPAAILQAPFFNMKADDAVNYGAIGVIIGHEITHGFDDQGRQYDKDGNLKDWWTKEDAEKFTKQVEPLIHQYNSYVALDTMRINGELTLGENIADVGGLSIALTALKMSMKGKPEPAKIDGFSWLQRYFLSYAQVWRGNIRDEELMKRLKTDVHSPGKFRTNGGTVNIPEFYSAFNIKEGDKNYLPEDKRAKIW